MDKKSNGNAHQDNVKYFKAINEVGAIKSILYRIEFFLWQKKLALHCAT